MKVYLLASEGRMRLLDVDLSRGELTTKMLDSALARDYLGGSGLAAAMMATSSLQAVDPLEPDNPLIWGTSPIVGTEVPSAGRYSVCALSPLTGLWGESNSGGFFGPALRFAGYDVLRVVGASNHPVWLEIQDGEATLRDARDLSGLDTYAKQAAVQERMGDPQGRVACIGVAGEHRVRFASIMNDHGRAAGRCGLGAVMGSKRLLAIGVRGQKPVPVDDPKALAVAVSGIHERTREDIAAQAIRMAGTAGYLDMATMYGDLPIRNFTVGDWEDASQLSGIRMSEEFLVRGRACYRCPIACGRETRAPSYALEQVDGPEYETLGALGSLLQIDDLEAVIHAGHLCNAHGLDTISTGGVLAVACELVELGRLDSHETGGLSFQFGDASMLAPAILAIAERRGFGQQLAEGSQRLAASFGESDIAMTVRGLDVPMHDPRAFHGQAVAYVLSPRGACHMQGDVYSVDTGQVELEELKIVPGDRLDSSSTKGETVARQMVWRSVYNALDLCQFQNPGSDLLLDAVNACTGWQLTRDQLIEAGRRILSLKRWINQTRGSTGEDDCLPARLTTALDAGGTQGTVPDLNAMLAAAYCELGWEFDGVVSRENLLAMGCSLEI